MIRTERAGLVDALDKLPEADWDKPSLCTGWTVREVVGHMIATATMTPPKFVGKLIGSGFDFQKLTRRDIDANTTGRTDAELVDRLRSRIDARTAPPGPAASWLGETIVHGEDIRRPLGLRRDYPTDTTTRVADFYKRSNLVIGAKRRIAGLALEATDTEWSHGDGPEVRGPILALLLVMSGRRAALDDLTGEGVEQLRSRP